MLEGQDQSLRALDPQVDRVAREAGETETVDGLARAGLRDDCARLQVLESVPNHALELVQQLGTQSRALLLVPLRGSGISTIASWRMRRARVKSMRPG